MPTASRHIIFNNWHTPRNDEEMMKKFVISLYLCQEVECQTYDRLMCNSVESTIIPAITDLETGLSAARKRLINIF
jgi:hypothetical protein